nr:hypothetical protein [Tanacetum cinerariifolium]
MIADAIAELKSFHEVHLALIDSKIVWIRNFHWQSTPSASSNHNTSLIAASVTTTFLLSTRACSAEMSWGWRKLLQIRELVKPFFWTKLGNGKSTSIWFDRWNLQCPLIQYLTPRDINSEGYNMQSCVADLISSEGWQWPHSWLLKAPNLGLLSAPSLVDTQMDMSQWRDLNGVCSNFSVKGAWEVLRPWGNEVPWCNVVWFPHNIPRHAFYFWLVMQRSLKTHDKIRRWDVGFNVDLNLLHCKLCMEMIPPILDDVILYLQPMAHKRNVLSVIGRILVAAASYFIWVEQNNRTFKNFRRSSEEIRDIIIVTVRLKLFTFRFKNTTKVNELLARWKMPKNFRLYGQSV